MMKEKLTKVIVAFFLSVIFFCPIFAQGNTASAPNINFSETVFDFGEVCEGEKAEHIFKFENIGDTGLVINKVSTSCGCTAAVVSEKSVPPQGEGEIKATLNTAGYKGVVTQRIYVQSNDPLNPTIPLQLRCDVKPEVDVNPRAIFLGDISKYSKVARQIKVIQVGGQELLIENVKKDKDFIKIESIEKKQSKGRNIYLVNIAITDKAPVGRFTGRIEIETNSKGKPNILVGIQGRILPNINVSPPRLTFGTKHGEKATGSVVVSADEENFEILKVESNIKYISGQMSTLEESKKYRLDFILGEDAPPGSLSGSIIVFTDCPQEREITIPIIGWVRQAEAKQLSASEPNPDSQEAKNAENEIQIGYFYERGCLDCDKAHDVLESLKAEFPAITVKEYDIGIRENMQLNEALCEIYNIPEDRRLIAPTIFIGDECVIGKGITKEKVVELIKKYSEGATLPLAKAKAMMNAAESGIAERFQRFSVPAIIAAGLLDGVNPCAFATIIFFISYLTILKRKGREIIIVGIAFTSAVFLTYFLIGIGLFEFLKYLTFLRYFTEILYAIVAAITLFLGIFSFWDFIKCRKGQATKSILQLPKFLKNKIHSAIKEKAHLRRYVFAAFITGFIVSVLELACTGQVYLPTIVYATGIGDLRFSAYIYLLLYNLMFITPLVVIFVLAYFGATAIDLSDTLSKNMALIKLLLSILFFIFTAFLIILIV